MQTITFRLADSLPKNVLTEIMATTDDATRRNRLEAMIDSGLGRCLLHDANIAALVQTALQHFDGTRYRLLAWVIMPNHVHAMIEQIEGFPMGGIVQGWKSFTSKAINKLQGTAGAVWAADYFDRFIRDEAHYLATLRYIEHNPIAAGLAVKAHD